MRASRPTIASFGVVGSFLALVALLAIGMAGNARAAELPFTGTLELHMATLPKVSIPGSGIASVSVSGVNHMAFLALSSGAFGPFATSIPETNNSELNSLIFTISQNLAGSFPGISGGPPGGGSMGISGVMKICLVFAPCMYAAVPFQLTPTPSGAGFGIGGTVAIPGAVSITLQHAPWTIGQPVMTIHTAASNLTSPVLPGGFAHGPASLTSSTAAAGAELQMVTATKAYTSLTGAFPEMPIFAVLDLRSTAAASSDCNDGEDDDGDGLTDFPDDPGCDDAEDLSEWSPALVCDNGFDDDGDGAVDVAEDPGCDSPTDPSEKTPLIDCDDGGDNDGDDLADMDDPGCAEPGDGTETDPDLVCDDGDDNDGDGLVDWADPDCEGPLDPFEHHCGNPIPFTLNDTEDSAPAISESRIAWQQWDGDDFEILLFDGSSAAPLTDNSANDTAPSLAGSMVVWEEWGAGNWRVMLSTGGPPVQLSAAGVDAWDPHTDGEDVVWSQGPSRFEPPEGVYHWDGSSTEKVPQSDGGVAPAIAGYKIIWETSAGIHMWRDGYYTELLSGSAGGHSPAFSAPNVVWHASDGTDNEIYLRNTTYTIPGSTQQLTDNDVDDRNADIDGDRIVWESPAGIQMWQGGETSLIAGSLGGHFPQVDDRDVVWQASDGGDNEILLWTQCVACNDGIDNDGDAKIDYDGGLAALGYVATEPDPQCRGNPWKQGETAYSPCGLGAELTLLLPPLLWLYRRRGQRGLSKTS